MKLRGAQNKKMLLPSNSDSDMDSFPSRQARQEILGASATDFAINNKDKETVEVSALSSTSVEKDIPVEQPAGQLALHILLDSDLPLPAFRSYITGSERRTDVEDKFTVEHFPFSYAPENTVYGHLRFALRYEPCDFGILYASLRLLGPDRLIEWLKNEPEGKESRRAWFFYETFTGEKLPVKDAQKGDFVEALSKEFHYVAFPRDSLRHRVRDNLLGTGSLCPTLRRTPKLEAFRARHLEEEACRITSKYQPEILARAMTLAMIDETLSSFALEGEVPDEKRKNDFLRALRLLPDFDPTDKSEFIKLQNSIVKAKERAQDWRDFQNFVGQQTRDYGVEVSFVSPRPEDVTYLMEGWMALTGRLCSEIGGTVDAVSAAAVSAFAFIFIHPFVDGNGRIHRFLIQYILRKLSFTPPNTFLPVSTSILRDRHLYDAALEAFSKSVMTGTIWEWRNEVTVLNDTRDLFRFFDATPQAEYLYDRVQNTIRHDLEKELCYLLSFDAACGGVGKIVELSDKKTELLVRLLLQNEGRLSKNKRRHFPDLTETEIAALENEVSLLLQTG